MLKAHEGEEDWPLAIAAANTNITLQKVTVQMQLYTRGKHDPINTG